MITTKNDQVVVVSMTIEEALNLRADLDLVSRYISATREGSFHENRELEVAQCTLDNLWLELGAEQSIEEEKCGAV